MAEVQLFHCPNCGAPLDLQGAASTIRCPYCNSSIIVPEALHGQDDWDDGEIALARDDRIDLGDEVIIESMDISNGDVLYVTAAGNLRRFEATTGKELEPYPDVGRNYYQNYLYLASNEPKVVRMTLRK